MDTTEIEAVKKIHKPYSDPSEPEDGPWCEYGDVWKWADDGEDICDECEKTFAYCRQVEVTYFNQQEGREGKGTK